MFRLSLLRVAPKVIQRKQRPLGTATGGAPAGATATSESISPGNNVTESRRTDAGPQPTRVPGAVARAMLRWPDVIRTMDPPRRRVSDAKELIGALSRTRDVPASEAAVTSMLRQALEQLDSAEKEELAVWVQEEVRAEIAHQKKMTRLRKAPQNNPHQPTDDPSTSVASKSVKVTDRSTTKYPLRQGYLRLVEQLVGSFDILQAMESDYEKGQKLEAISRQAATMKRSNVTDEIRMKFLAYVRQHIDACRSAAAIGQAFQYLEDIESRRGVTSGGAQDSPSGEERRHPQFAELCHCFSERLKRIVLEGRLGRSRVQWLGAIKTVALLHGLYHKQDEGLSTFAAVNQRKPASPSANTEEEESINAVVLSALLDAWSQTDGGVRALLTDTRLLIDLIPVFRHRPLSDPQWKHLLECLACCLAADITTSKWREVVIALPELAACPEALLHVLSVIQQSPAFEVEQQVAFLFFLAPYEAFAQKHLQLPAGEQEGEGGEVTRSTKMTLTNTLCEIIKGHLQKLQAEAAAENATMAHTLALHDFVKLLSKTAVKALNPEALSVGEQDHDAGGGAAAGSAGFHQRIPGKSKVSLSVESRLPQLHELLESVAKDVVVGLPQWDLADLAELYSELLFLIPGAIPAAIVDCLSTTSTHYLQDCPEEKVDRVVRALWQIDQQQRILLKQRQREKPVEEEGNMGSLGAGVLSDGGSGGGNTAAGEEGERQHHYGVVPPPSALDKNFAVICGRLATWKDIASVASQPLRILNLLWRTKRLLSPNLDKSLDPNVLSALERVLASLAPKIVQHIEHPCPLKALGTVVIRLGMMQRIGAAVALKEIAQIPHLEERFRTLNDLESLIGLAAAITSSPDIQPPAPLVHLLQERLVLKTTPDSVDVGTFLGVCRMLYRMGGRSAAADWLSRIHPALRTKSLETASLWQLVQLVKILSQIGAQKHSKEVVQRVTNAMVKRWGNASVETVEQILPCAVQLGSQTLLNLALSKSVQLAGVMPDESIRHVLTHLSESQAAMKAYLVGTRPRLLKWVAEGSAGDCILLAKCLATAKIDMCKPMLGDGAKQLANLNPQREDVKQFLEHAVAAGGLDVPAVTDLAKAHQFRFAKKD